MEVVANSILDLFFNELTFLGYESLCTQIKNKSFQVEPLPEEDGGPNWNEYFPVIRDDLSWFFLQSYWCRRILGELGYFKSDSNGFNKDPWLQLKTNKLEEDLQEFVPFSVDVDFKKAIHDCLWGSKPGSILKDDSQFCEEIFNSMKDDFLIYVIGECGISLLMDLCLIRYLIFSKGLKVSIHVGEFPFSFAPTVQDIHSHVEKMGDLGIQLKSYLENGELTILSHPFYCTPTPFVQLPNDLKEEYVKSNLVFFRGNVTFQHLLEGVQTNSSLGDILSKFISLPAIVIRKTSLMTSADYFDETTQKLGLDDAGWLASATYGLIQVWNPNQQKTVILNEDGVVVAGDRIENNQTVEQQQNNVIIIPTETMVITEDDSIVSQSNENFIQEERNSTSTANRSVKTPSIRVPVKQMHIEGASGDDTQTSSTDQPKRQKTDFKFPSRQISALEFFSRTRPDIQNMHYLQATYSKLTRAEKSVFESKAQADKARYERELVARAAQVALTLDAEEYLSSAEHY